MKKSTSLYIALFSVSLSGITHASEAPYRHQEKGMRYAGLTTAEYGNEVIRTKAYQQKYNGSASLAAEKEQRNLKNAQYKNQHGCNMPTPTPTARVIVGAPGWTTLKLTKNNIK